jgi:Holliday junction resolvase RusA-like endonuclease
MGDTTTIVLPLPPTTNKLWAPVRTRTGARMVKRAASADWAAQARRLVAQQSPAMIAGPFRAVILLPEGRFDIDGPIKSLLDACQAGGAIKNDKHCRSLHVDFDASREGTALVELIPIPPPQRQPVRTKGHAGKEPTS